ncbi:MAG: circularly permuted type 2 ATP-grasp protein [Parapedobacter sp.]|nr:MAG: circularly permuted type 2 ATP-grasp protein [Parapedobacter sp.]
MINDHFFKHYIPNSTNWDEMCDSKSIRKPYLSVFSNLQQLNIDTLISKHNIASELFMNQGITFTVYNNEEGIERIFPFDIIPRIITGSEWEQIERGIAQRLKALNLFIKDIYNEQQVIHDGIIPASLIATCPHYKREIFGIKVPHDIYVHISGIDLIRGNDGKFYVLEDNLRTPSGVSYMLENREVTKRIFPDMLAANNVRRISSYPVILHEILLELASTQISNPRVVLLTPGIYNSAYYEHSFLARQMGIDLAEGRDLVVENHKVYMKTTKGLEQVHVIYRRIDDEYLDPLVFLKNSAIGVPGLIGAYRKGNVAIVNAVGNGVADDKAVYAYVPELIKYYLHETPILENVPTYQLSDPDARKYVMENHQNMVIKSTNQSGGYGMVMGNTITEKDWLKAKVIIENNPRNYIAQPIVALSTVPCFIDGKVVPRHVDLRPYALCGPKGIQLVPGGLTRVALKEGSLVVNSSQGGGSKDTWVIDDPDYLT